MDNVNNWNWSAIYCQKPDAITSGFTRLHRLNLLQNCKVLKKNEKQTTLEKGTIVLKIIIMRAWKPLALWSQIAFSHRRKTKFMSTKSTICLPKWQFWRQIPQKYYRNQPSLRNVAFHFHWLTSLFYVANGAYIWSKMRFRKAAETWL